MLNNNPYTAIFLRKCCQDATQARRLKGPVGRCGVACFPARFDANEHVIRYNISMHVYTEQKQQRDDLVWQPEEPTAINLTQIIFQPEPLPVIEA